MLSAPKSLIDNLMNGEDTNASGDFHNVIVNSMGPVGPTWSGQG